MTKKHAEEGEFLQYCELKKHTLKQKKHTHNKEKRGSFCDVLDTFQGYFCDVMGQFLQCLKQKKVTHKQKKHAIYVL